MKIISIMFFYLSKIFSFLFAPVVWFFIFFIIGLVLKKRILKKWFIILSLFGLYLFSNQFILNEAFVLWEIPARADSAYSKSYDLGIVLGGMLRYYRDIDRIEFSRKTDRIFQAIRLYKKGIIKKIFISGGSGDINNQNVKEALLLRKFLSDIGIPVKDVIIESESRNTRQNALYTRKILDEMGFKGEFLLITSGYHMRRSLACFLKVGIIADSFSTEHRGGERSFNSVQMLLPSPRALFDWEMIIHECIGYVVYFIMDYI